jgi:RNA polymerase sigma factor (sigma-70 family)
LRRRKRAASLGIASGDAMERIACQDLTAEAAQLNELMDRLCEELAKLPERQATAFWLCCVEECSYAEIAGQMETNANDVGVLIHRARQQVREALSDLKLSQTKE